MVHILINIFYDLFEKLSSSDILRKIPEQGIIKIITLIIMK
jgi:hypothetical protein